MGKVTFTTKKITIGFVSTVLSRYWIDNEDILPDSSKLARVC